LTNSIEPARCPQVARRSSSFISSDTESPALDAASGPPQHTLQPHLTGGQRAVIKGTLAVSAARQTRVRLNMPPPGLNIYAAQSCTENTRFCVQGADHEHDDQGQLPFCGYSPVPRRRRAQLRGT
jgi:hypothetical protein